MFGKTEVDSLLQSLLICHNKKLIATANLRDSRQLRGTYCQIVAAPQIELNTRAQCFCSQLFFVAFM